MRAFSSPTDPSPVVLRGTGAAAVAALWRLSAAGAPIRWYVDRADVGEEIALAHALGGGRLELSFEDPPRAPLDGAAVRDDHDVVTERENSAARRVRDVLARLGARVRRLRHLAEPEAA